MEISVKKRLAEQLINLVFLALLNIALMMVYGYLCLDIHANWNSRFAAFLLSFLLPYFIVTKTAQLSGIERLLKYGSGFIFYIFSALIIMGLPRSFTTGLLPVLLLALATLYYGTSLIKKQA